MSKKPFLDTQTIVKHFIPFFATVIVFIVTLCLPIDDNRKIGLVLLFLVFGGLTFMVSFSKFIDSLSNLKYLKNNGYYEKMCLESPEHFDDLYAFTDTFVFSRDRKICLPIERIRSVQPYIVRCINNSSKSKVQLTVYMDDGDEYCFILKTGAVTEERIAMITRCITTLMRRNPHITIEK